MDTGTFITRDPLGFVDGPNMYAYVVQNPWTKFDPEGLVGVEDALAYGTMASEAVVLNPVTRAMPPFIIISNVAALMIINGLPEQAGENGYLNHQK